MTPPHKYFLYFLLHLSETNTLNTLNKKLCNLLRPKKINTQVRSTADTRIEVGLLVQGGKGNDKQTNIASTINYFIAWPHGSRSNILGYLGVH